MRSSFFWLLFVVVVILFLDWNWFLISSLMIWFCFIFVSKLVVFLFKSTFFKSLLLFFFKFTPDYFGWLGILHCYFFRFDFYVVTWPHDLYHKFWRLDRVSFNHFLKISFIIIEFIGNWHSFFFFICFGFIC